MDKRHFKKLDLVADVIITGYRNGMTLVEIADAHECAPATVSNLLKSRGEPRRRRGPKGPRNEKV
jgi:hypothetical protein